MNHSFSESTSTSLIARVRSGQGDAWLRLTQLYGPLVYSWARRGGLQDSDAADVGQDVFHVVSQRVDSFDQERAVGSFRGWLWTITRNKLGDHYRRQQKQPNSPGGSEFVERLNQLPDQAPEHTSTAGEILGALAHRALCLIQTEFEETTWRAFWMSVVDNQDHPTIARTLGISPQAVRQAKYRVTKRLRNELDDPGLDPSQT